MTASLSHTPLLVQNPFKEIRIQQNLSQAKLAELIGVSKHAVLRLEQGMYAEPLPTILNFMCDEWGYSHANLRLHYANFQASHRYNSGLIFGADLRKALDYWAAVPHWHAKHPFIYLRETAKPYLNPTEVAKALCINQTVISYFEKKFISQKTVPEQVLLALSHAGYTDDDLYALQSAYNNYRSRMAREKQVSHVSA